MKEWAVIPYYCYVTEMNVKLCQLKSHLTEELHERLERADALLVFFVLSEQKLFYCACFPTFPKDADSRGVEALTQSCLC